LQLDVLVNLFLFKPIELFYSHLEFGTKGQAMINKTPFSKWIILSLDQILTSNKGQDKTRS